MGKRELLIVIGFVAIGALAYQLTAPAPKEGESGFSFSGMVKELRREMHGDPGSATKTHEGTIPAPASLTELRITGIGGRLEVVGEDRADIAYELRVTSTGPDNAAAMALAEQTSLRQDDLGSTLAVRVSYPRQARQRSGLKVRVPRRLAVRIEGGGGSEATTLSSMRSVHLEGVVGDVRISVVEGKVSGTHRNGELSVVDVGAADIAISSSRATFKDVRGTLAVNARNGECKIEGARAPIEIDESNTNVTITGSTASVRVSGSNGSVTIERPRGEVSVDVRRAEVEVTLATPTRLTLLTTDEPLRLLLEGTGSIDVDAIATEGGKIDASDVGVTATGSDQEARMLHTFGEAGGPRVALRNLRGKIVIRKAK